jgi:hypothetical protein
MPPPFEGEEALRVPPTRLMKPPPTPPSPSRGTGGSQKETNSDLDKHPCWRRLENSSKISEAKSGDSREDHEEGIWHPRSSTTEKTAQL